MWLRACAALASLAVAGAGAAQSSPLEDPEISRRFTIFRWREDYSDLADPSKRTSWQARYKYVPLGTHPSSYLSFGGEVRVKVEGSNEPAFGLREAGGFAALDARIALHGLLQAGRYVAVFAEMAFAEQTGREPGPRPFDESYLSLVQGFVDLRLPSKGFDLEFRLGRQLLAYGSFRLTSIRDAVNIRRSFDAARFAIRTDVGALDAFYGREVEVGPGVFDDDFGGGIQFWGVYSAWRELLGRGVSFDGYYYGIDRRNAAFRDVLGRETRHTLALRFHGVRGSFDFDVEVGVQLGSFAGHAIRAFGVGSSYGYTFVKARFKPRLGLKVDYASGDGGAPNGALGTFNPLFPAVSYFSYAPELTPSNAFGFRPELAMQLIESFSAELSAAFAWRARLGDAVYAPGPFPLVPGGLSNERGIAIFYNCDLVWLISGALELRGSLIYIDALGTIEAAGGSDQIFGFAWVRYWF